MERKTKISILVGVILLLISILGVTYAYFMVGTTNGFGTPKIDAATPSVGIVTLKSTEHNLYLTLSRSDMMSNNTGVYYAVTEDNKEASKDKNEVELGYTQVTGEGIFTCNYTLNVTYTGDMKENITKDGVLILNVNGIDYDVYSTEFPKEIIGTFENISSSVSKNITASLRFNNLEERQDELKNKNIKLEINATEFSCTAIESDSTSNDKTMNLEGMARYLVDNTSSTELWNSSLEEDGYRFVGTNPNNYVCFGTTDKEECISNSDKYMYRIIGIFEDSNNVGHVKLLKKDVLTTQYQWHSSNSTNTAWNSSALYTGLIGDYYLNNTEYSYMQDETWLNKITEWNYTLTNTKTDEKKGPTYNNLTASEIYLHELNRSSKTSTIGAWGSASVKIGLMYASDFALSLGESSLSSSGVNNKDTLVTGWVHTSNNSEETASLEWTITRYGKKNLQYYNSICISSNGTIGNAYVNTKAAVRPVFYLESNVTLLENGAIGSLSDPYIISE